MLQTGISDMATTIATKEVWTQLDATHELSLSGDWRLIVLPVCLRSRKADPTIS